MKILRATTKNQLVTHCKKKQIQVKDVEAVYIGDGGLGVSETVAFVTGIADYFKAPVHFVCQGSPGTCHASTREAALDDYKRRREAGELPPGEEVDEDDIDG